MKTILVATDFSPAALNAANYAADMAKACNAKLYLLHVYQMPLFFLQVPLAVTIDEMIKDAQKEIGHLQEELSTRTGGKINIETEIRMGSFLTELNTVCERIAPYYVVMGSQGTTAAERLFFGSHAIYAKEHLTWPLITVPPGAAFSSLKKIGLALDFDRVDEAIPLDEIKTLVNDFHAELDIINTGKVDEFKPEIVPESGLLRKMLAPVKPNFRFIINPDTNEGIVDFMDKNNIDLLIILPGRHGLLDKLVHKSHSKQLILHNHIPVLAIRQ